MFSWKVDGQQQLNQQWFWYRIGNSSPESSINTISAPSPTTPDARTLYTTYNNGAYGVQVIYFLTGQSPGSGQSQINETITITNATATALDFHFFQYSDFEMGGTPGGDTIQLGQNNFGKFNEADQSEGTAFFSESDITGLNSGANHGEAAYYNATLVKLNDGSPTTLNDNPSELVPGDVTWAFEWDFTIAPGSSVGISKLKTLQIPEPSTLALVSCGLFALAVHRRARRSR